MKLHVLFLSFYVLLLSAWPSIKERGQIIDKKICTCCIKKDRAKTEGAAKNTPGASNPFEGCSQCAAVLHTTLYSFIFSAFKIISGQSYPEIYPKYISPALDFWQPPKLL